MNRLTLLLLGAFLACSLASANEKLVVHEWGTFTSLQDEDGNAIGGINTDDEPVPDFVHRVAYNLLLSPSEAPPTFFQGAPSCHPDVTMRLETPVLYFHPPAGWKAQPVDVHVAFRGGWLTEFYPQAIFREPGLDKTHPKEAFSNEAGEPKPQWFSFGHIRKDAAGELLWKGLAIGAGGDGPETKEKVWLAPRAVDAARVETGTGERERFLFYRGVGNVDASLRVVRNEENKTLKVKEGAHQVPERGLPKIHGAWLVEVNASGACAFRSLGALGWPAQPVIPAAFPTQDFLPANMARLRGEMRSSLIKEGLFADEAEALLKTWEISYFKSPGIRLFYVCRRAEVDATLPLEVAVPAEITRVMIGRIEIVTPEQRALLRKIAGGPAPELRKMRGVTDDSQSDFFKHPENVANWNAVLVGKAPYSVLGLPIPDIYSDYLKLGRFRNALILDEEKRRPTEALQDFITKNSFKAYQVD